MPSHIRFRQEGQLDYGFKEGNQDIMGVRLHVWLTGTGSLLQEVCGDATSVAAAVLFVVCICIVGVSATIGGDVVLHANQTVGMVMVGHDRNHQHHQADGKQEKCDVLFLFHTSIFDRLQR